MTTGRASRTATTVSSFEQHAPEAAPEVLVEYRVYDRIDGRVHVAQPEGDGESLRRYVAHRTQRLQYVHEEERKPARDERAHDEAEYERGALLLLPGDAPLLALGVTGLGPRLARRRRVCGRAARVRGTGLVLMVINAAAARHGHLARVQYVPFGLGRRRLGRLAADAEYGLAQPRLDRFDGAALLHVARVRRRRFQFADHVRVHGHAGRSAPAAAAAQVAVDRQPAAALRGEHFQRVLVAVLAHVAGARVAGVVASDHRQRGVDRRGGRRPERGQRHAGRRRPRDEAGRLRQGGRALRGRGRGGGCFRRLGRPLFWLRRRFPDSPPRSRLGRKVYPDVNEHHDARRYVERTECRVYPVAQVLAQLKHTKNVDVSIILVAFT